MENSIPESTWESKRADIAGEINLREDTCRGLLRDGWVQYLKEAYPEGGAAQDSRRADGIPKQKRVVPDGDN